MSSLLLTCEDTSALAPDSKKEIGEVCRTARTNAAKPINARA